MEGVGQHIANCIKPPFHLPATAKEDGDEMQLLFNFNPEEVMRLDGQSILESRKEEVNNQTRQRQQKASSIDNYRTDYLLMVLVRYKPSIKLYNFYYTYGYESNTSNFQWACSASEKQKRQLAVGARCRARLVDELVRVG
ncbi:hypothetical protein HDV00_010622 [Rhizophlyctis rosea]|nr:hypothetical protein HDV00_010622 [Rhizophlyctis rosea]